MKKIWKLLFLVLMLVFSFSGCGQKNVQEDNRELVRTGEKSPVCYFAASGRFKMTICAKVILLDRPA